MTKINFENDFEIYLFLYSDKTQSTSKLNEFLSFLKYNKTPVPYKFSFVGQEASLIPEMTLNQNMMIDFNPNSLTESKEVQFQDYLQGHCNKALESLYNRVETPREKPELVGNEIKKICTLIKSLLYEGEFLFLDSPEDHLSPENLDLFVQALKGQMAEKKQNVFIFSTNLSFWLPHGQKLVRRTESFNFEVSSISKNFISEEERESFYTKSANEGAEVIELNFKLPSSKESAISTAKESTKPAKIKVA